MVTITNQRGASCGAGRRGVEAQMGAGCGPVGGPQCQGGGDTLESKVDVGRVGEAVGEAVSGQVSRQGGEGGGGWRVYMVE